jgi:23S rRNA (cytosine1962-C5)-methyltransferase
MAFFMNLNPKYQTVSFDDYELLDIGDSEKLERFGDLILIRPEISAKNTSKSIKNWENLAHCKFVQDSGNKGRWIDINNHVKNWIIDFKSTRISLEFYPFKHIGVFPEQAKNWDLLSKKLNKDTSFLNLFAYTGVSSLVAAKTGAKVIHIDSSKSINEKAKTNFESNNIDSISCITEDAVKFAEKEVRRGNRYDAIQMDPPAFGYASNKKKWTIKKQLPVLLELSSKLLKNNGILILNTYSPTINKEFILTEAKKHFSNVEVGLLWTKSKSGKFLVHGHLLYAKIN